MSAIILAILNGLRLRCPRCYRGAMFAGFRIRAACPVCDLPFERASGEITSGGIAINTLLTCALLIGGACLLGLNPAVPLVPLLVGLVLFGLAFPIGFYRSSQGLWASFMYLTGANQETD